MLKLSSRIIATGPAGKGFALLAALFCFSAGDLPGVKASLQETTRFAVCTSDQEEGRDPCGGGGSGPGPTGTINPVWEFLRQQDQEPFINADSGSFGVVPGTGEYVRQEIDLHLPGRGFDFVLTRTYRSRATITTVWEKGGTSATTRR